MAVVTLTTGCGGGGSEKRAAKQPTATASATTYAQKSRDGASDRQAFCESSKGKALEQAGTDFTEASNQLDEKAALRFYERAVKLGKQAPKGAACAYSGLSQIAFVLQSAENNLPGLDVDKLRSRVVAMQKQRGLNKPIP